MLEPAAFLAAISKSGVLAPELERNLVAWSKAMAASSELIGTHALAQKWLTPYQIQRLHTGKGHKLTFGPYLVLDILGEGGMGRVYQARHRRMGREVALKVIRRERVSNAQVVRRFQQEVRAVGQMMHPNIVLAVDADSVGSTHFVAMELIEGVDFAKLVEAHGPMPQPVACEYVRQVAVGLQHAFEHGMVHRDIKPSNLMVTRGGIVKILDFGLALLNEPDPRVKADRVTLEGFVLGTPDYLAPEQASNPQMVDSRADLYALGGTLFFLLSGRIPYDGPTAMAKLLRHANDPPPSVRQWRPDLPPQLDGLIQWLMAKRPEQRPQVPLQVAAALQAFCRMPQPTVGAESSQAFRIPTSEASQRKPVVKSSPWSIIIAMGVLLGTVALAAIVMKKLNYF